MPRIEFELLEEPIKTDIDTKGGVTEPRPRQRRKTFLQVVQESREEIAKHLVAPLKELDSEEFKKEWEEVFREHNRKSAASWLHAKTVIITD